MRKWAKKMSGKCKLYTISKQNLHFTTLLFCVGTNFRLILTEQFYNIYYNTTRARILQKKKFNFILLMPYTHYKYTFPRME